MIGNDRRGKFVELVGAAAFEDAFRTKIRRRRWAVALVTFGISLLGLWLMLDVVGANGWTPLKVTEVGLFGLLFTSLSFGFSQAFLGFLVLAEGREPLKITNTLHNDTPLASTAVVMPVHNEDTEAVFGNIRALYDSLQERGELESYDFYILSDSTDPARAVEEGMAWADLCRQTNGFGKIHYRRRKLPLNRKSGNIVDFCRRWGNRYRYMVVLDADSVMTGTAVSSLVRLMATNPRAGIIQTMPRLVKAETVKELSARFELKLRDGDQFIHAVLDPFYNAVHVSLQRERETSSSAVDNYGASLAAKLFEEGPGALSAQERRALLADGQTLAYLHTLIWKTPSETMNPEWAKALMEYRR